MLYYVSNADIPGKKAHVIQQLRMCQSFERAGADICFLHPSYGKVRKQVSWDQLQATYGLQTEFDIQTIPSFQSRVDRLPQLRLLSMAGTMTSSLMGRILRGTIGSSDTIYGRNYYGMFPLSKLVSLLPTRRRPTLVFEHHDTISAHCKQQFFDGIDGIVCITEAIKQYDQQQYGIPENKCFVAPDGVDLAQYESLTQERARAHLDIPA